MRDVEEATGITPPALRSRPALKPQYRHLLEAFYEASAGRSIGEVVQPLATGEICDYLERVMAVESQSERESLFTLFRKLDGAFLRNMVDKMKAARK